MTRTNPNHIPCLEISSSLHDPNKPQSYAASRAMYSVSIPCLGVTSSLHDPKKPQSYAASRAMYSVSIPCLGVTFPDPNKPQFGGDFLFAWPEQTPIIFPVWGLLSHCMTRTNPNHMLHRGLFIQLVFPVWGLLPHCMTRTNPNHMLHRGLCIQLVFPVWGLLPHCMTRTNPNHMLHRGLCIQLVFPPWYTMLGASILALTIINGSATLSDPRTKILWIAYHSRFPFIFVSSTATAYYDYISTNIIWFSQISW